MNKIVSKILLIILIFLFSIYVITNKSYAKYYIIDSLEAVNINIVL